MATRRSAFLAALGLLGFLSACGGNSTGPSGVTVKVPDGGTGGPVGATITITSAGANPRNVTIAVGQTVTFVNNDTRSHEMASDPHPQHGSCPSMEAGLGTIGPGQTRTTHNFGGTGTCGFHDHLDDNNANLRGSIVVQ